MAILKDNLNSEKANFSFRIYGSEPDVLSIAVTTENTKEAYEYTVIKLNKEDVLQLAKKLLNAHSLIKAID